MNKIPLSVSSSLTNVPSSAALMVTPYGNQTGGTGEFEVTIDETRVSAPTVVSA